MNLVNIFESGMTLDLDDVSLVEVPKPSHKQIVSKFLNEEVYLAHHGSNAALVVSLELMILTDVLEQVGVELTWYLADANEVRTKLK